MPLFGKKEEGRVPLNNDVISKCKCDACPVQANSACSRPKIQNMMNMRGMSHMEHQASAKASGMSMSLSQEPMEKMNVNPTDLPGPYCTIGVAACKDLDSSKACICPTCQVYKDYNLMQARPVEHFCFNDKAT